MTAALTLVGLAGGTGLLLLPGRGRRLPARSAARGRRRSGRPGPTGASDKLRTPGERSDATPSRGQLAVVIVAVPVACLVLLGPVHGVLVAAGLVPAGLAGLRVAARHRPRDRADRSVALVLDLAAAALRGGRPVTDALTLAAPAASDAVRPDLLRVAGLLRLGADPARAWADLRAGPLAEVAAAAVRSSASGIRLADAFERAAVECRAESALAAATRAQRAGVAAMGPLSACFLPSFVCLGIVPVIVGIARSALGVLP